MDKRKLLIADSSEEFRVALADALRGAYQIRLCADGRQAQQLLREFKPDILVLDLMLPGYDGISLLQWALEQELHPMVLATTRFFGDYVVESLERMNVGYVMVKPCDLVAAVHRISDLSARLRPRPDVRPDPRNQASGLLRTLGVPTKLRGYIYLREAVLLMMSDCTQSITKELYPEVARICGCAPAHVERSIRSAVAAAWEHRDERVWSLYFQPDENGAILRPSNGTFITRLADSLANCFPEVVYQPETVQKVLEIR